MCLVRLPPALVFVAIEICPQAATNGASPPSSTAMGLDHAMVLKPLFSRMLKLWHRPATTAANVQVRDPLCRADS
jgi:hypothetical protein